ncbi:MAG TPA: hypothetical protein PLA19_01675 [Candidatus Pacearchaeota archaeon]|nr:hypothetical protein [Candidatus Pacearchaeota archaeon]
MLKINRKIFFIVAGFAAVAIALAAGLFFPLVGGIRKIAQTTAEFRAAAAVDDLRVDNAADFARFAKEEKENFLALAAVFADTAMPLDLIGTLENAAATAGARIEFLPLPAAPAGAATLRLEAKISGSAPATLRLIEKIENSPYLIEIENASIFSETPAASENTEEAGMVQGRILLKIYAKTQKK